MVQTHKTNRGEIEEVCLLAENRLELVSGGADFVVLHLQLDLTHLKFMYELIRLRKGKAGPGLFDVDVSHTKCTSCFRGSISSG